MSTNTQSRAGKSFLCFGEGGPLIAGILLAAGQSRRFGSQKLLLRMGDKPLIYYSLKNCIDSRLPEVFVVVGAQSEELKATIRQFIFNKKRINIVTNEDYKRGMMSSLKRGIRSLHTACRGAMVLLADMPLVTPDIINHLMDAFEKNDTIIIPECGGELFHPRILPARVFPDFLQLEDSEKGTTVLERHKHEIIRVKTCSKINFVDIDQPDDGEALAELLKIRAG